MVVRVSSGVLQGQGLWVKQTWVTFNSTTETPELTQDWGNRLLEDTNKSLCMHARTQEKGAVTPQETDPDLPVSVQESPVRRGSVVACCRAGGTECSSACMGPVEGGGHYPHYLHHSLAPGVTPVIVTKCLAYAKNHQSTL